MDRRRVALAVVVVAVLALAGCSRPPPEAEVVCDGCVGGIEETAEETNRSITVEDSVTHVYLRDSGDARVEARMTLSGADADDLRVNDSLLATVGERIEAGGTETEEYGDEYGYGYERSRPALPRADLTAEMDGTELVVTYTAENLSHTGLGATLSTHFFRADGDTLPDEQDPDEPWHIGTDRLVVHGPDGTEPLVEPPDATAEGSRLVWDGDDRIDTRTYLVYGNGGPGGGVRARAAIGIEVFTWAAPPAFFGAIVPTALLFGVTLLYGLYYPGRVEGSWRAREDGLCWASVGGTVTVLAAVAGMLVEPTLSLVLIVVVPVTVAALWWVFGRDAADEPDEADEPDGSTDAEPATAEGASDGETAAGTTTDAHDFAGDVEPEPPALDAGDAGMAPGFRTLLAVAASLGAVLVVTVLVAVDYRATYTGTVALAAGAVPFLAFPVLAYAVTRPDRADLRSALVVVTAAAPWLAAFPLAVRGGTETLGALAITFVWGVGVVFVGIVLFYVVLWVVTRVTRRPASTPDRYGRL
ncbi:hypothetical protein BRC78_02655 [Halobacteriales archaeon QH_8_68_33]|nr:MAG: hypothetical protein BRC78_02655 [Halobacteriales archaeon QH_8_68_33]